MSQNVSMKIQILDAAEKRARKTGFSEMSFREIAQDVGIKSSSVHYHFPTKADLGEALIENYSERFQIRLEEIDKSDCRKAVEKFVALYSEALVLDEAICLCAIFGAEALGLPTSITDKTKAFFEMNFDWLNNLFAKHGIDTKSELAMLIVAALEGAIIVSSTSRDRETFEGVAQQILDVVYSKIA